mgnify:CR=1 FL=1
MMQLLQELPWWVRVMVMVALVALQLASAGTVWEQAAAAAPRVRQWAAAAAAASRPRMVASVAAWGAWVPAYVAVSAARR